MPTVNVYQKAWELLEKEIDRKTGWGKLELKLLMLKLLIEAGR